MKNTRDAIWKAVLEQCVIMTEGDDSLVMYTDAEALFHENFNYYYNLIIDKFMELKDEHLDRHKLAAVIICAIIKSDIVGRACDQKSEQRANDMFLANEKLALNVALSDMHQRLVAEYQSGKIPYERLPQKYIFPRPLSCDRQYTEVICRDLYFAKKYFELNPMTIANFLFLLEAYSFEVSKIGIDESEWENINNSRRKRQWEKELKNVESLLLDFDKNMERKKTELENKKVELKNKLKDLE